MSDMKREAVSLIQDSYNIDWETWSTPAAVHMLDTLRDIVEKIPDMEQLLHKVRAGEHASVEGQPSSLSYESREHYAELIERELFASYQIEYVYNTVTAVNDIIQRSTRGID